MIKKQTKLSEVLELGKPCKYCCTKEVVCCKNGSGMVLISEVKGLAEKMNMKEDEFKEKFLDETERFNTRLFQFKQKRDGKPYGPCILFDDETSKCTIHEFKPLHCKVGNCGNEHGEQLSIWFMLNYLVNNEDAESIRQYEIYLRTHPTIEGGQLNELVEKEKLGKILSFERLK